MTKSTPPVPKANKPRKAPAGAQPKAVKKPAPRTDVPENTAEQGESANIRQNTTNQGRRRSR